MPTPVRFYRKLNGTSVRKPSSLDGLDIDEIGMYDMLDDLIKATNYELNPI